MPTHMNSGSATCVGLHQEKQCTWEGGGAHLAFLMEVMEVRGHLVSRAQRGNATCLRSQRKCEDLKLEGVP